MSEQYNYYKYRDQAEDQKIMSEAEASAKANYDKNKIQHKIQAANVEFFKQQRGIGPNIVDDMLTQYDAQIEMEAEQAQKEADMADLEEDAQELENISILENGKFRFNNIILDIPPEQIAIHVDEYETSLQMMRSDAPVAAQSGRKRIRIIVNFPIDTKAFTFNKLSKMIIQIRKTPIATIENEKIRGELFGEDQVYSNIGVVVDNLSGYVDDDYPDLLRCTLQMTWFNHAPYVEEIRYVEKKGETLISQRVPSKRFTRFYEEGTTNGPFMINSPELLMNIRTGESPDSLVIMWKDYQEYASAVSLVDLGSQSKLVPSVKTKHEKAYRFNMELRNKGWYLAEEDDEKWDDVTDGIFYRWRKFEIPFRDLYQSGSLILQNVSFSLSTNPAYINMEGYSMPTIQFLGGSASELRAIVFAAAEYASSQDKTPIGTSAYLIELNAILRKVSEDRLKFPKFAKENHLLISHPIAKLMKYRSHSRKDGFRYVENDNETLRDFKIDDFLPVVATGIQSTTVAGLPFASRVQIDFKETRLAKAEKQLVYEGTSGANSFKNSMKTKQAIIKEFYNQNQIKWDPIVRFHAGVKEKNYQLAEKLDNFLYAINCLAFFDSTIRDIDDIFNSKIFPYEKLSETPGLEDNLTPSGIKVKAGYRSSSTPFSNPNKLIRSSEVFTDHWMDQFIVALYLTFAYGIKNGADWTKPYTTLFEDFANIKPKGTKDLYPDMMLPPGEINPAFYFDDNSKRVIRFKEKIFKKIPLNHKALWEGREIIRDGLPFKIPGIADTIMNGRDRPEGAKESTKGFPSAFNHAVRTKQSGEGAPRIHDMNNAGLQTVMIQQAIAEASPPTHSLQQVYPTFQVHLFSDRFRTAQKYSGNDLSQKDLEDSRGYSLLDMFDLSSILDIRIIKDEYEAADVMIIRILNTQKNLMTTEGRDPSYSPENFSWFNETKDIPASVSTENGARKYTPAETVTTTQGTFNKAFKGQTTGAAGTNSLEVLGLKEGTKIRAMLGYSNDLDTLGLEFNGRIAAINGKDVIEMYCVSDGHELIQNTIGHGKAEHFTENSETVDLIREILAGADEVKSFGNTNYEVLRGIGLNLPAFLGGRSSLDNITAPSLQAPITPMSLLSGTINTGLDIIFTTGGMGIATIGAAATATFVLANFGLVAAGVAITAGAWNLYKAAQVAINPAEFAVYQQTIWDVLQELTLRHPGYIASIVPFDNRSTIYFGEPDGMYFHRGIESALEQAVKLIGMRDVGKNASFGDIRENAKYEEVKNFSPDSFQSFILPNVKTGDFLKNLEKIKGSNAIENLTLTGMQKTFRSYHMVTSEHDIISNDIEVSSVDMANSVQIYHPKGENDIDPSGKKWISSYALSDKMKADDDLFSHYVNNKIFTFHNAHNEFDDLELPQRYAKAILCKELENMYRGKISILGRPGIKPHDVVVLRDTHNKISGPVGVRRVVNIISPTTGWVTNIYPKFIAIPDTSAGAFQMKSVLKACRFWLGNEAQMFYSNMQKFNPVEGADPDKRDTEFDRALEFLIAGEQYEDLEEEVSKDEMAKEGEHATSRPDVFETGAGIVAQEGFARTAGVKRAVKDVDGNIVKGKINTANAIFDKRKREAKAVAYKFRVTGRVAKNSLKNKAIISGTTKTAIAGGKALWKGGIIAAKGIFKTVGGIGGGIAVDYMLGAATDGLINYMKYRQPISIFPLNKEGRPWTAGLNGFKQNTVIEHLEEQGVRAGDKFGMAWNIFQQFQKDWDGDAPQDVGYGGQYQVAKKVDGDTIHIQNGNTIEQLRIKGYDTGETYGDAGPNERLMGELAKQRLNQLIDENGNSVEIIRGLPDKSGTRTTADVSIKGKPVMESLREESLIANYPKSAPKDYGNREAFWGKFLEERKKKGFSNEVKK